MKKLVSVLMNVFYGPVLCVFSLTYLPKFLMRLGQADDKRRMIRERFGFVARPFPKNAIVWIHAVSVGEVLATQELIRMMRVAYPDYKIVLSTTTPTGQSLAKKMENDFLRAVYFPMDFRSVIRRFMSTIKPQLILIMETELWPNLIREAKARQIPMGILNGRISDRAITRYRWAKEWFGELLSDVPFFLVRTDRDRERFLELGAPNEKIRVTGNMKFDIEAERNSIQASEARKRLGIDTNFVIVAGSTHEGEEEMMLRVFRRLKEQHQTIKLLIAPRHIERSQKVKALAESFLEGHVSLVGLNGSSHSDVFIMDTMGELSKFYGIADLVFVGGSLIPHGGQNPIEAARERRVILHGPYVYNFNDIYATLDHERGAILVQDEQGLFERMNELINNEENRKTMGSQAFNVVDRLRGASQKNLKFLEPWLNHQRSLL